MAALHTDVNEVGSVAERAGVTRSRMRNGQNAPARASAGQPPLVTMVCGERFPWLLRQPFLAPNNRSTFALATNGLEASAPGPPFQSPWTP